MLNHGIHTIRAIQIATSNINPHNRHRAQPSLAFTLEIRELCWKDNQRPLAKPLFLPTTYESVIMRHGKVLISAQLCGQRILSITGGRFPETDTEVWR
jgi:hypothetical protein